jgi:hypothetical protein
VIFDGDLQHQGTADEADTISKNRNILNLLGVALDFPNNVANEKHLGLKEH